MRIIIFACENLSLTGGNLYDSLLYKVIRQDASFTVEFCEPKIYKSGFAIKKLITPFLELHWLKKLRNNDVFFWNSVDAYHFFLLVFLLRLFSPKKKVYILHHHYKFELMSGLKRKFFKFFELNFLRMASSIVIPSPYILGETRKYFPSSNINYLEIAFEDKKQNIEIGQVKKGHMLFVGTIEERKGLHLLLDTLSLLKTEKNDFVVNILGGVTEDEYYENLLKKISEYGLENHVFFHGRVNEKVKSDYMKMSEVFIFPSLLEGYGMVLLEAMSFGLPVVAFNNSAIPFTVQDGFNGLLATNKDVVDLKQKLSDILKDSSLREKLSVGALDTFSKSRRLPQLIEDMKGFTEDIKS
jgi:glycosyltransferase involved in cell wall biosynthesis